MSMVVERGVAMLAFGLGFRGQWQWWLGPGASADIELYARTADSDILRAIESLGNEPVSGASIAKNLEIVNLGYTWQARLHKGADAILNSMPRRMNKPRNLAAGPNSFGDPWIRGSTRQESVEEHIVLCVDVGHRVTSMEFIGKSSRGYVDHVWKLDVVQAKWFHHHYAGSFGATPSAPHYHCGSQRAPSFQDGGAGPSESWLRAFADSPSCSYFVDMEVDDPIRGPPGNFLLKILSSDGWERATELLNVADRQSLPKLLRASLAYLNALPNKEDDSTQRKMLAKNAALYGLLLGSAPAPLWTMDSSTALLGSAPASPWTIDSSAARLLTSILAGLACAWLVRFMLVKVISLSSIRSSQCETTSGLIAGFVPKDVGARASSASSTSDGDSTEFDSSAESDTTSDSD